MTSHVHLCRNIRVVHRLAAMLQSTSSRDIQTVVYVPN